MRCVVNCCIQQTYGDGRRCAPAAIYRKGGAHRGKRPMPMSRGRLPKMTVHMHGTTNGECRNMREPTNTAAIKHKERNRGEAIGTAPGLLRPLCSFVAATLPLGLADGRKNKRPNDVILITP